MSVRRSRTSPVNKDDSIKALFGESVQAFEEHSKRIEALLDRANAKFDNDHTGFSAAVGVGLIVASIVLAFFGRAETLTIILAVLGGLLFLAALLLRFLAADRQAKHAELQIVLERERARLAVRISVLRHMWLYDQP